MHTMGIYSYMFRNGKAGRQRTNEKTIYRYPVYFFTGDKILPEIFKRLRFVEIFFFRHKPAA